MIMNQVTRNGLIETSKDRQLEKQFAEFQQLAYIFLRIIVSMQKFEIISEFLPTGDQPQAIDDLVKGSKTKMNQTLLGVTGSGKTFTVANVIANTGKNALIISHNKTLAAQLYS